VYVLSDGETDYVEVLLDASGRKQWIITSEGDILALPDSTSVSILMMLK
jgi:hypothetical protein